MIANRSCIHNIRYIFTKTIGEYMKADECDLFRALNLLYGCFV
jgi:hypothetical protein